jgi:polyhydroxyalkanoate synthase subunit PhaC
VALGQLVGSRDYSEHAFTGGHIGIYVSGKACSTIPALMGEWLLARS